MSRTHTDRTSISANVYENSVQIKLLYVAHKDEPSNGLACLGPSQRILFWKTAKVRETAAGDAYFYSVSIVNIYIILICEIFLDFKKIYINIFFTIKIHVLECRR
ncbi:MAG: hypothetical protein EBT20_18740 [Alphaproteobacteria bacterium]|nr:hypothetical protein [Alphaproteobacteria bacterium]